MKTDIANSFIIEFIYALLTAVSVKRKFLVFISRGLKNSCGCGYSLLGRRSHYAIVLCKSVNGKLSEL